MSRHNRERRARRKGLPKYAGEILSAAGWLKPGCAYVLPVRHEPRCSLLRGVGPCDCNPEVGRPERVPAPEEN